jgi:hypothetical protein
MENIFSSFSQQAESLLYKGEENKNNVLITTVF